MLSCWGESPLQRPTFTKLRATIDSMLLADRKGDYLEFSLDGSLTKPFRHSQITDGDGGSICTSSSLHFPDLSQGIGTHNGCSDQPGSTFKLMLNTADVDRMDGECTLTPSSSGHSIFLGKESLSPKHCSPDLSAKSRPLSKLESQLFSVPHGQQSPKQSSPARLLVDRQSLDNQSTCSRLSFMGSNNQIGEDSGEVSRGAERPRPMSLLLSRERDHGKANSSDRYVKEPTKLINLNVPVDMTVFGGAQGFGASGRGGVANGGGGASGEGRASERGGRAIRGGGPSAGTGAGGGVGAGGRDRASERGNGTSGGSQTGGGGETSVGGGASAGGGASGFGGGGEGGGEQVLRLFDGLDDGHNLLRRRSDGIINMNSDGYVSFLELHPGMSRHQNHAPPDLPQIQITTTEDL